MKCLLSSDIGAPNSVVYEGGSLSSCFAIWISDSKCVCFVGAFDTAFGVHKWNNGFLSYLDALNLRIFAEDSLDKKVMKEYQFTHGAS